MAADFPNNLEVLIARLFPEICLYAALEKLRTLIPQMTFENSSYHAFLIMLGFFFFLLCFNLKITFKMNIKSVCDS